MGGHKKFVGKVKKQTLKDFQNVHEIDSITFNLLLKINLCTLPYLKALNSCLEINT